jgi:hypothetical protein
VSYAAHVLLIEIPVVALAAVSIILAWQHRTLATALAALGFGSAALSHSLSAFVGFYTSTADSDPTAAFHLFSWTWPVIHWGSVVGLCVGSLSLLWHTLRQWNLASANNERRGP